MLDDLEGLRLILLDGLEFLLKLDLLEDLVLLLVGLLDLTEDLVADLVLLLFCRVVALLEDDLVELGTSDLRVALLEES